MRRSTATAAVLSAMIFACALPAVAQGHADDTFDCYDVRVSARIVRQVPSAYPDCGDGCIVTSWPWFIDLDVGRVLDGVLSDRKLSVLTIQHTSFRAGLGFRRWLLRRNTLGGYNAIAFFEPKEIRRCDADAAPMEPYLRPSNGKTLSDLRREGEALYNSGH
jgi:hypothetical protein